MSLLKIYPRSAYLLALLLLLSAGMAAWLVQTQHTKNLSMSHDNAERMMSLISSSIITELRKGNYQDIPVIVNNWGSKSNNIILLEVKSKNGYLLARHQQKKDFDNFIQLSHRQPYSYQGFATINLHIDMTPTYHLRDVLAYQLAGILLLLFVLIGYLTWLSASRKEKSIRLGELNIELLKSDAKYRRLVGNLQGICSFR